MNNAIFDYFGVNETWDKITDILLFLIIAAFLVFGVMGIMQWITRKSLKKVDKELVSVIPSLVLMVIIDVFFEKIWIVNYRPVLVNGVAESSFPSVHTMVSITLGLMMIKFFARYIKNKTLRNVASVVLIIMIILTSFGRILAGKHWMTDVWGGVIFGVLLVVLHLAILKLLNKKEAKEKR